MSSEPLDISTSEVEITAKAAAGLRTASGCSPVKKKFSFPMRIFRGSKMFP